MKIERKRFVVMRKNRTEIWGGLAQHFKFRPISDIGEFAIKTYRSEKQAYTCSSWDRDFEVVPISEIITDEKQSEGEWEEQLEEYGETYCFVGFQCSKCEKEFSVPYEVDRDDWLQMMKFCPNCGAKMKGGAE